MAEFLAGSGLKLRAVSWLQSTAVSCTVSRLAIKLVQDLLEKLTLVAMAELVGNMFSNSPYLPNLLTNDRKRRQADIQAVSQTSAARPSVLRPEDL
eukprot:g43580.t1